MAISKILSNNQSLLKTAISNKKLDKDFSEEFSSASKRERESTLDKLMKSIRKKGKQILDTKSITSVQEYKSYIKDYLSIVLKDAYRVEKITNLYGTPTTLIEIINKELSELAQTILVHEKDTISIVNKIEHIEGLLLDTYS